MMPEILNAFCRVAAIERKDRVPIFLQGEVPIGLWMLEAGEVQIIRTSRTGKDVVLESLAPGDFAGLASVVGDVPHETSAQTRGPCRLRFLPRCELLLILERDHKSSAAVARLLAIELAAAHRWIGHTTLLRSSKSRLATFLLEATPAELARLSHSEIAGRIGISRETVSRSVIKFRASGALSAELGPLRIRDRNQLERMAS
jgi:CRP/FNR family cyclic AMP-dependent transcriptional regulator